MEVDQGGEDGDDWQAHLSQAIEDMFQEGEPENAQRGVQAHARAKKQGKMVRPAHEHAELRKEAIYDLGKLLTIAEVLRACKLNKVQVVSEQLSTSDLVTHLLQLISGWIARGLRNKIAALQRFQLYLEEHHQGVTIHEEISAVTMNKFFTWIHQQASMKENLGGDGTRAVKGAYDSLIFFSANWGFRFHVKDCHSTLPSLNTRTNSRKPAKSARPFSIGMVALISSFVTDKNADPVLRHIGCCILLMCYTGIRFVQMQNFTLYGEHDGVVYGQVFRKNPKHNRHEDPDAEWANVVLTVPRPYVESVRSRLPRDDEGFSKNLQPALRQDVYPKRVQGP